MEYMANKGCLLKNPLSYLFCNSFNRLLYINRVSGKVQADESFICLAEPFTVICTLFTV